jgi:SAM-dependent methyltransferase
VTARVTSLVSRLKRRLASPVPDSPPAGSRREAIHERLACPSCLGGLVPAEGSFVHACGAKHRMVDGVPVFIAPGQTYEDRRHVTGHTNPYSGKTLELVAAHAGELILDFGAGNPAPHELFDNVVRLDFAHYTACDVVANTRNIPFRDQSFDHAVSESVFEHVSDPWQYGRELHRVMKKGGQVIVDTAFLQPLHGDPFHFFNMTLHGLEEVMKPFRKLKSGVEPYQSSGMTMNILRNHFIESVGDEAAKGRLRQLFGEVNFVDYDRFIPPERQHVMAAGVYFVGTKD